MNTEAHLAMGWILAHLGGREDRRFRAIVVAAALAPDIDAASYIFGSWTYADWHHVLGHNVFFSVLVSAVAMLLSRRSGWGLLKILLFTQIAFYTHYFGDYFYSGFPQEYWWPISKEGFRYPHHMALNHPINQVFGYLSLVTIVVIGIVCKRTPMEFFSVELNKRIVNLFRRKTLTCHICHGRANERCAVCGEPVCQRHGRLTRRFAVVCSECHMARVAPQKENQ